MQKIDAVSGDLRIRIQSEDSDAAALWRRALRHLIEEADVHGWEKANLEYGDEPLTRERYCFDVLLSLATAYKAETDLYKPDTNPTKDQPEPLGEVLTAVLSRLEEAGFLGELVLPPIEDESDLFGT